MRTILLHIAVLCIAYEVVQGLPQLCALKDFKLNENKTGTSKYQRDSYCLFWGFVPLENFSSR